MGNKVTAQTTINLSTPTTIAASNVCKGTPNVNIYSFRLTGTVAAGTNSVTAVSFTQSGTATVPTDITQYKLWKNAGSGAGVLVASSFTASFSGFTEVINNGVSTDYWITADIAAGATTGNTVIVNNMTTANLTVSGATSGTGRVAGGTQTIQPLPTVGGITALPTPICSGATLTLTATGGVTGTGVLTSYNWSGPAGYSSNSATNTKNYIVPNNTASGVYSVTVTYPGVGCTSIPHASSAVTVNNVPVLAATMFICTGVLTTMNSGNTTGTWTSSNGAAAVIGLNSGVVSPGTLGGVTTITNRTTCGNASTTATIAATPRAIWGPNGLPGGSDQYVCTGATISLSSATNGGVWSSSFPSIASVVAGPVNPTTVTGGNIAPGSGATTIIYTIPATGCDTTIVVNVNPTPFPIQPLKDSVCIGAQITLTDITPLGTWSSSNSALATVTYNNGVVTGAVVGLPVIKYTIVNTGCFVTRTVTVNPLPLPIVGDSIVCTGGNTTLTDGTANGTWSSQFPSVASVASTTNPLVTGGTFGGFTNIVYTLNTTGCFQTHLMQVNQQPGPIVGPNILCAGNTIVLSDAVLGGTWFSSNSSIAAVGSSNGVVYGQYSSPLQTFTNINYNLARCLAVSYSVTVNPAPGPITGVPNVCIGFTTALSDTTAGGIWSNSDLTATYDSFTVVPVVRGISQGFSVITYTLPSTGCYDTIPVIIYPNPTPIFGPDTVCVGATTTIFDTTVGGTWSSTVLSTAEVVDSSGVVTGISAGNVTMSYTMPTGCYATMPFRVKPTVVASVSISKSPGGITCAGTILTFTAVPVNGGVPTYQWHTFIGGPVSPGPTYFLNPAINGDIVMCDMTPHQSCTSQTDVIDTFIADIYPNAGTQVTITVAPSDTFATFVGQVFTFFSTVTYGGTNPAYQWYKDGVVIPGATASSYSTPVYQDAAFICQVTGNAPCDPSPTFGFSNKITIHATYLGVTPAPIATSSLALFPNPSNGSIVLSGTLNTVSNSDLNIEVVDMLGRVVYSGKALLQNGVVHEQLELGNIPSGAYLLHVNSEAVNQVFRFVISK